MRLEVDSSTLEAVGTPEFVVAGRMGDDYVSQALDLGMSLSLANCTASHRDGPFVTAIMDRLHGPVNYNLISGGMKCRYDWTHRRRHR